jgi:hypothetical protein
MGREAFQTLEQLPLGRLNEYGSQKLVAAFTLTVRSTLVLCDANPAPPNVCMSRVPLKVAMGEDTEQSRKDCDAPPLTRSSLEVQSSGDHGLDMY